MAIEVKELVIRTSVDNNDKSGREKAFGDDLKNIKSDIIKECMEKVKDYLDRQKEK